MTIHSVEQVVSTRPAQILISSGSSPHITPSQYAERTKPTNFITPSDLPVVARKKTYVVPFSSSCCFAALAMASASSLSMSISGSPNSPKELKRALIWSKSLMVVAECQKSADRKDRKEVRKARTSPGSKGRVGDLSIGNGGNSSRRTTKNEGSGKSHKWGKYWWSKCAGFCTSWMNRKRLNYECLNGKEEDEPWKRCWCSDE